MILMIEKLKEFFYGELDIEDIRSFQILNPQKGKLVGLWEVEYLVTIRFTIENEELFNDMMGE